MLYDVYDYTPRADGIQDIELIYTQLGRSVKHPDWSVRYIYDGPNLQKYIDQALKCSRTRDSNPDNSYFTAEGIMYKGYV